MTCRWRFPGVGEYQCCDKYMLADLRAAACAAGHPEWGHGGPHDAGHYNSRSWDTGFFRSQGGNWQTEYGHFFLSWYSGLLVRHARRVLGAAAEVLNKPERPRMLRAVKEVSCSCSTSNVSKLMLLQTDHSSLEPTVDRWPRFAGMPVSTTEKRLCPS